MEKVLAEMIDKHNSIIEWGVASATLPGQTESGDLYFLKESSDNVLAGVVDGLGHGKEAAIAARMTIETLQQHPEESVITLLQLAHEKLRTTRGVVLSLASFNARENMMTWLGVGNVEGILFRADANAVPPRELVPLRGGVVGYQLPQPFASVVQISPGDTLLFFTDGIRSGFHESKKICSDPPDKIANDIYWRYGKGTDDALVLVVRYRGVQP